jgi:hypothetical protein
MFVYVLNFLHRTIIYILFPLIKAEAAYVTEIAGINLRGLGIAIYFFQRQHRGLPDRLEFNRLFERQIRCDGKSVNDALRAARLPGCLSVKRDLFVCRKQNAARLNCA